MSFQMIGKLNIKERMLKNGNGSFMVAELVGEEGTFSVKNDVLVQFTPGSYEGSFTVQKFFSKPYVTGSGQVIVETRAILDWDALSIMAQSENLEDSGSLDVSAAVAESVAENEASGHASFDDAPVKPKATFSGFESDDLISDKAFLENAIAQGDAEIKLDPTMPEFRALIGKVKEAGYRFNPKKQSWYLEKVA